MTDGYSGDSTVTVGVPFVPKRVRGFVQSGVFEDGRWEITLTGIPGAFWLKDGDRLRLGDEVTLEVDGGTIIGVLLRLV